MYDIFGEIWNNKRFRLSAISVIVMCFIAHAYAYFNATFFHDRQTFFNEIVFDSAKRTKWFAQYVDCLTAFAYLPWLFGILTIIYFIISIYVIVDVLDVQRGLSIFLIAGLCITHYSILGAHLFWPHEILAALPLACISVWIWNKSNWSVIARILLSGIFIGLSMATYGSYASVGPTLVILSSITLLLIGENYKNVLKRDIEYIGSFSFGVVFYYVVLRLFLRIQNLQLLSYMGEDNLTKKIDIIKILEYVKLAYFSAIKQYLGMYSEYSTGVKTSKMMPIWIAKFILILGIVMFLILLWEAKDKIKNKASVLLLILLVELLPLSVSLIYVMSFNNVHFLMTFTYVMVYVYIVKLVELFYKKERIKISPPILSITVVIMMAFIVYYNVLVNHIAYSKVENNYIISKSIATNLVARIENCEGFSGNEEVVFVGDLCYSDYFNGNKNSDVNYFSYLDNMGILDKECINSFSYEGAMFPFIKNIIGSNLGLINYSEHLFNEVSLDVIEKMPLYPADGSVIKIGNYIIVKISR